MRIFSDFFDTSGALGTKSGIYSPSFGRIDRLKAGFERREKVSFEWFNASCNFVKNSEFIYSIKRTSNIFCKVYLSIKPEKYIKVMVILQKFIDKLYAKYPNEEIGGCKFRRVPANDAIVIRFACKEHYEEFLKFLDENSEIQKSFDAPNLFIPRDDHGLSILPDQNSSYNFFVTKMI